MEHVAADPLTCRSVCTCPSAGIVVVWTCDESCAHTRDLSAPDGSVTHSPQACPFAGTSTESFCVPKALLANVAV